jgi:ubiquitin-like 1-activating enzyme E1 B
MGSEDFGKQIFNKVFRDDIDRLRSMEDMWKTRKAPESLEYDQVKPQLEQIQEGASHHDQKLWSLAENVAVFEDR